MLCPKCASKTDVKDSRPKSFEGFQTTRRRRVCQSCSHLFSTIEMLMEATRPAPKPPAPKPVKKRTPWQSKRSKGRPRTKLEDLDNMTDEQLEAWMNSGDPLLDEL